MECVRLLQFHLEVDDLVFELSDLLVVLFKLTDSGLSQNNHGIESFFGSLKKKYFDVRRLQLRLHVTHTFRKFVHLLLLHFF